MKKIILFLFPLALFAQNTDETKFSDIFHGVWTSKEIAKKYLSLPSSSNTFSYSWGLDYYYEVSTIIDYGRTFSELGSNIQDKNESILKRQGYSYAINDFKKINNSTYLVFLHDPRNIINHDMDSVVVFHIEYQNSFWIETIESFSERTNNSDYKEYVRSPWDFNNFIEQENSLSNSEKVIYYRHYIDLENDHLYASVNNSFVRLRSVPNLNGEGMGFLQEGDSVQILEISDHMEKIGENIDNWYKVKTSDGTEAWTFGAFLDFPESAYVWYDGVTEGK